MKRKHAIIASIVSLVAAAGLGLAASAPEAAPPTLSTSAIALAAASTGFGGRSHGWHRGERKGGFARLCGHGHGARIDDLAAFVGGFLDFTPEQGQAWEKLTEALRDGDASIAAACAEIADAGEAGTAPRELARLETALAAGLDVVRQVRPAFDEFYGALDDNQRTAVDDVFAEGHRH